MITAVALVVGGIVAALHAPTPRAALARGWWMGPALAVAMVLVAVVTTISFSVVAPSPGGGTVGPDLLLTLAIMLGAGAVGGTLGALIAPGLPRSVIGRRARLTRGDAPGPAVPQPRREDSRGRS